MPFCWFLTQCPGLVNLGKVLMSTKYFLSFCWKYFSNWLFLPTKFWILLPQDFYWILLNLVVVRNTPEIEYQPCICKALSLQLCTVKVNLWMRHGVRRFLESWREFQYFCSENPSKISDQMAVKACIFYKKHFLKESWPRNLKLLRISSTTVILKNLPFD